MLQNQKFLLSFAGKMNSMKSIILSITAMALSFSAFAQYTLEADYRMEGGVYGGISAFTHARNTLYSGDHNKVPYVAGANLYYNFTEHFQAGVDLNVTHWESTGSTKVGGVQNKPGFSENTRYLLADYAYSLTVRANYVLPMYDGFNIHRSSFYAGASAGAVFTVNDGKSNFGQLNDRPGAENRYLETYHYEAGTGYSLGVQVGFNYYISNHVGFSVEGAPRYVHMNNKNHDIGTSNGQYNLFYFPTTLGVRLRF